MKVMSVNGGRRLPFKKSCAAIGIFDGVHRGHQYLIAQMVAAAKRLKATPLVVTFFPHPAHVLRPDLPLGYLTSLTDRLALLESLGVAACIVVPFNKTFAKILPEKFIKDILIRKLNMKAVFIGEDFRFGRDRRGDIDLFKRLGSEFEYEAHAVAALKEAGTVISSTRIRRLIGEGKLTAAAKLLGRPVFTSGRIVRGAQRGRKLGFATANVAFESDIIPPQGVYIVKATIGAKAYGAMANIGTRPSFEANNRQLFLEVHIFDFAKNIYGKKIKVEFLKKIRSEKRFTTPQALIQQIKKDETCARRFLA